MAMTLSIVGCKREVFAPDNNSCPCITSQDSVDETIAHAQIRAFYAIGAWDTIVPIPAYGVKESLLSSDNPRNYSSYLNARKVWLDGTNCTDSVEIVGFESRNYVKMISDLIKNNYFECSDCETGETTSLTIEDNILTATKYKDGAVNRQETVDLTGVIDYGTLVRNNVNDCFHDNYDFTMYVDYKMLLVAKPNIQNYDSEISGKKILNSKQFRKRIMEKFEMVVLTIGTFKIKNSYF